MGGLAAGEVGRSKAASSDIQGELQEWAAAGKCGLQQEAFLAFVETSRCTGAKHAPYLIETLTSIWTRNRAKAEVVGWRT